MNSFGESEGLDKYEDNLQTNDVCPKSGNWTCSDHTGVKLFVKQGDYFPKCPQGGHNAVWYRIMNRNEL